MDDRFASDLQIALYANLLPEYPSSDLSSENHSYALIRQNRKLSQGEEQCRQNIYVNVPPIYMNLPSVETKDHDEINLVPSCRDKSDLYCQQKMPLTIPSICPISIHNRTHTRRTRRPRPRVVHRYSGHTRRRIRRPRSRRRNVEEPSIPSADDDDEEPISTLSKKIVRSISENLPIESVRPTRDETSDDELFPHETFEDFLFRRRTQSSRSSSSSSSSSSLTEKSPPTPPKNRPSLSKRYARGMTLGLEESDVNFLHRLIERSREDREILHRINMLREAYRRAAMNQNGFPRHSPMPIVHPWISQQFQNGIEKYDQLYEMNPEETCPSTVDRFKHFLSTVKRRAQDNFQQLKKNFRTFRTRLIMETISSPSHHRRRYYHTTDLHRMRRSRPSQHRQTHHRPHYTR